MRKILAFLSRDFRAWSSYRFSVLLQVAGMFFVLMVFFFISLAVEIREQSAIRDYADNYFDFVVVGLAVATYVTVSLSGFSGHVREAQISGTLEALLVTPTSVSILVFGSTVWDYVNATLRFFALLVLAHLFFAVPIVWMNLPLALLVLVLVVLAFSGVGLLSAAFVMVFKRGDPLAQAIAWFSMLLGGVYFPTAAVGEEALESFAELLPLTPALRALRLLLLRGEPLAGIAYELGALATMAALLLPVGLLAFSLGIRAARRNGSLTHY